MYHANDIWLIYASLFYLCVYICFVFFCRMFIWRSLLHLPENHAAFSSLTDKGLHSAYMCLQERYPIKSHKLQRGLQRWTQHQSIDDL